jgi:FKBP-type peptidyl-prolyl cis-trans isomerase 2
MIRNGSSVKMHYTLTVEGAVVDSSQGQEPLAFVMGSGQIISGLEEALEGLEAGAKKQVRVPPEKAYGPRDENAVHKVPKTAFQMDRELKPGDVVGGQIGDQPFQAVIEAVGAEEITLNLNHPLAGKTLDFEVEIVSAD